MNGILTFLLNPQWMMEKYPSFHYVLSPPFDKNVQTECNKDGGIGDGQTDMRNEMS